MHPRAEIFSQGEELVTGQTVDTNAAWLSEQLSDIGFDVVRHSTVGDELEHLVALLKEIPARAELCICTGGLGPTTDDLTATAVAAAFDRPLVFDPEAYQQIQCYYQARNRTMPDSNRKQAMLPADAERLDNVWGTAPGFMLQHQACRFAFLPGVPYEMRQLFSVKIKPQLAKLFSLNPGHLVIIKTVGIGESDIQERVSKVTLPPSVQLGFRADPQEVQTKLLFPAESSSEERSQVSRLVAKQLEQYVFAIDGIDGTAGDLVEVIGTMMAQQQKTLATFETLTQGLIAGKCLGENWLLENRYVRNLQSFCQRQQLSYCNDQQQDHAKAMAGELAQWIKHQSGADYGLAQYAKVDSNQLKDNQQRIPICQALAFEDQIIAEQKHVSGSAYRKQNQAAILALDFFRRQLLRH